MKTNLLTIGIILGGICLAQESRLAGPVSGLVFDGQAKAIRPILGVAGSSYLGAALVEHLDFASVSPSGGRALAVREGRLSLVKLGADLEWTTLVEEFAGAERASWSQDSNSVAVYGAESGLRVFRHLDGAFEAAVLGAPKGVTALRVLEDGSGALFATAAGVHLANGESRLLAALEGASALALDGETVYAASRERSEVIAIRHFLESPEVELVANEARGIAGPAGLAVNGHDLLIASGSAKSVYRLNAATGELLGTVELDFAPDGLELAARSAAGETFYSLRSRGAPSDPFELLDAARGSAFFVPAGVEAGVAVEE